MEQLSKIRFTLILPVAIIVAGCTASLQDEQVGCYPEDPEFTVICDNVRGYTYKQPSWIRGVNLKEREVSVSTYDYPLTEGEREQLKNIYDGVIPSPPSCASSSVYEEDKKIIEIGDMTAEWGKIGSDLKSGYGILTDDMYCRYSNLNCSSEEFWTGGCEDDTAVYGFCAENKGSPLTKKDDKRVVICISQQTDNEKQAEEIFKTFRWTE